LACGEVASIAGGKNHELKDCRCDGQNCRHQVLQLGGIRGQRIGLIRKVLEGVAVLVVGSGLQLVQQIGVPLKDRPERHDYLAEQDRIGSHQRLLKQLERQRRVVLDRGQVDRRRRQCLDLSRRQALHSLVDGLVKLFAQVNGDRNILIKIGTNRTQACSFGAARHGNRVRNELKNFEIERDVRHQSLQKGE